MKLGQLIVIVMCNIFTNNFAQYGGLDLKSTYFLIYQPITINQNTVIMSLWYFNLEGVH